MKWKNAANDGLPRHSRTVLISHHGVYHIAFYDSEKDVFRLHEGNIQALPARGNTQVYWTVLPGETANAPLRVLIADDDEDDQEMMRQGLQRVTSNPEIHSVSDGAQAIDYLLRRNGFDTAQTPNLVLLDLNLPKQDGYSVIRHVRTQPELDSLPIYVVSTSGNLQDWKKAMSLGANGYYRKGSSSLELMRIVKEITTDFYGGD